MTSTDLGAGVGSSHHLADSLHSSVGSVHQPANNSAIYEFDATLGKLTFNGKSYAVKVLVGKTWVPAVITDKTDKERVKLVSEQVNKSVQGLLKLAHLEKQEFEVAEFYDTGKYRFKPPADKDFTEKTLSGGEVALSKGFIQSVYTNLDIKQTPTAQSEDDDDDFHDASDKSIHPAKGAEGSKKRDDVSATPKGKGDKGNGGALLTVRGLQALQVPVKLVRRRKMMISRMPAIRVFILQRARKALKKEMM